MNDGTGKAGLTDIADQKKWLRATTHSLLTRFSKWRRRVKIGLVIGGGFVAGAAGVAANLLDPALKWQVYIFQIIGLALVFAGGVLMDFLDEGAPDAIKRANELVDAAEERDEIISSLGEDFEWFTRLYATAAALRDVVEGVAASGPGTEDDQMRRFAAMLDVVVADKAILFGMNSDRWNFAIYSYDSGLGCLICIACRRPIRAEEEAPHRSWKPGEGHIGIAFQMRREIVAGDTSEPEARALFDAPEPNRHEDDRERYRSIASLPIRLAGEEPLGILVATSDVPDRFHLRDRDEETARDPVEPLRILANALALVIKTTDLYNRKKQQDARIMTQPIVKEWPKSDIETLDREIGTRLQRLSAGRATAQDVSEASRLIRDRADFMMPGVFRRLRLRQSEKKAS